MGTRWLPESDGLQNPLSRFHGVNPLVLRFSKETITVSHSRVQVLRVNTLKHAKVTKALTVDPAAQARQGIARRGRGDTRIRILLE